MVVYQGKQVIVTGVDRGGDLVQIHPVASLGDCYWVGVGDLRSDTLQELKDELTAALVVVVS